MGKSQNINFGLVVSLADAEANAITTQVPQGQSASDKLSISAGGLLRDLAHGGVMLAPEWAQRVEAAIGSTDPAAIVAAVEKSVGREGDAYIVPWRVDPTQIAYYQSLAENAGVSMPHQLKAILDHAYEQGWLGMGAPDVFKILLTAEQYRYLQRLLENDAVTGEDVIDLLHTKVGGAAFVAEDDDDALVLESLGEKAV